MKPSVCTKIMFLQCELPGYGIVEIFLMYWLDFRFHCCTNIFRNLILWVLLYCRMDIDYSPTGREFVTGSYDRTVSSFLPHVNIWFWSLPLRKEGIHVIVRIHCHFSRFYYHNGFFFSFSDLLTSTCVGKNIQLWWWPQQGNIPYQEDAKVRGFRFSSNGPCSVFLVFQLLKKFDSFLWCRQENFLKFHLFWGCL